MAVVDILIIIFILFGAVVGFKQGFTKSLVNCIGVILVAVIAYILKNPLSNFLMSIGPFFEFGGIIKGVTVLNIALYEMIAFGLIFGVLMTVLKIVSITTGIFEAILNFTIVFGIPSKILGAIVGVIKNYIIVFFVLYILSTPAFSSIEFMEQSKYREPILQDTPLLSKAAETSMNIFNEFKSLKDKYENTDSSNQFNLETLDLFLKYKLVTPDTVQNLSDKGKIHINGIEGIIQKYKEKKQWI